MNIRPLYDRIVVKRLNEQESTHNGIVIPDSAKEKPQKGEVLAIGRGKRLEDGRLVALAGRGKTAEIDKICNSHYAEFDINRPQGAY